MTGGLGNPRNHVLVCVFSVVRGLGNVRVENEDIRVIPSCLSWILFDAFLVVYPRFYDRSDMPFRGRDAYRRQVQG